MAYELWDRETRNLVGTYRTQEDALADVRAEIEDNGRAAAELLSLGWEDSRGRTKVIAAGPALVALALGAESTERLRA